MLTNYFNRIRNFVKDQGGMEALQTICLIAIAFMILLGAIKMGNSGKSWMNGEFKGLKGEASQTEGGDDAVSEEDDSDDDDDFDEGFIEFPEDDLSDVSGDDVEDLADELE